MSPPAARRLPDDHPAWKDLRPLGYECSRWLKAAATLQVRCRKGRLNGQLGSFLEAWMPEAPLPIALPDTFEIVFAQGSLQGLDGAGFVGQPVWQALLHLPALRDFWTAELRASHYAHLLKIVPESWLMDPAPLPPGSVIAGLGIGHWSELGRLEGEGRVFSRHSLGENKVVLTAVSAIGEGWLARCTLRDGQIILQDAYLH